MERKQLKVLGYNVDLFSYNDAIDYTKYLVLFFTFVIALKSARCHPFFVYALLIYCYSEIEKFINKYKFQKLTKIFDIALFFITFS